MQLKKKNYYIKGDNLEVMKLLQSSSNKVDFVYLDPPYLSGRVYSIRPDSNDESLVEEKQDCIKGDNELDDRLNLAWKLLSDNGVLVLTMGEKNLFNAKHQLDQVCGEEAFVCLIVVEFTYKSQLNVKFENDTVIPQTEFALVYSKNTQNNIIKNKLYDYSENYLNEYQYIETTEKDSDTMLLIDCLPARFRVYDTLQEAYLVSPAFRDYININKDRIFKLDGNQKSYLGERFGICDDFERTVGFRIERGTLWKGFNKDAVTLQQEGGISFFNGKKPVRLIQQLIYMFTDENATVLDPYSGSGTTAHAIMKLNSSFPKSNRSFILIQRPELTVRGPFSDICELALTRIMNCYYFLQKKYGYSMEFEIINTLSESR